jgi:anti-anti-sigma factor
MAFSVNENTSGSATLLRLEGRIDASNAPEAEKTLFEYLDSEAKIGLDFSSLEFVSSAGLRIFLMMAKRLKANKGSLVFFSLPKVVREVFDISGFSKILTIKETEEEALAILSGD